MPNQDSDKKSNSPKDIRKQKPAYILTDEGMKKLKEVFNKLFDSDQPSKAKLHGVVNLDKSTIDKILNPHKKKGVNEDSLNRFFEKLEEHCLDKNKDITKFRVKIDYKSVNRETKNFTNQGKNINEKTPILVNNKDNSIAINKELLNKYLLSLNCCEQKKQFQNKTNSQVGFFIIQADTKVSSWLRCVLEQKIGGFKTATKIPIKLGYAERQDFDSNFPQKFKHAMKTADNISIDMLVTTLAELYRQKTVIIYISSNSGFTFEQLKKLSSFYSQLVKKTSHTRKQHKQVNKPIYFILFLIEELKHNINSQNFKNISLLSLNEISHNDVNSWLISMQNQHDSQTLLNIDNGTFKQAKQFSIDPYAAIDDICGCVFKLNEGIEEIQNYWKLEHT
ncbi:hypothetical protein DSM106972_027000 [Dulcicalothrix desertica PCC 7102]|uniref:Uncharacterized protein n=1 Tax=Dulcicalothrix desertica PCC 7102 TaxID=232991 RepID=A0A3S1J239_9CYAN|nr:hypothetical protein [Dulcicalothrix desertica]RUT06443.1 hypothetical protein DSM106972_027000 [Dulcicalothrix desertica PCC 7102]TWH50413.1 hypothetical protein CAL7102_04715 [Dulcicalothrix desertica PCC 7102]